MRLERDEQAVTVVEKQHKKEPLSITFLGIFFTVLTGVLVNQGYETTNERDKLAGFFIYGICGIVTIFCSLIYHAKYEKWGARELFENHMGNGRWRHTVSFAFAMAACGLLFGLNKGNMDKAPPDGFWSQVGKRLLNTVLLLTVVDLNGAKKLYSNLTKKKNTDEAEPEAVTSSSDRPAVEAATTEEGINTNEPIAAATTTTSRPTLLPPQRLFSTNVVIINDENSEDDSPRLHPYRSPTVSTYE